MRILKACEQRSCVREGGDPFGLSMRRGSVYVVLREESASAEGGYPLWLWSSTQPKPMEVALPTPMYLARPRSFESHCLLLSGASTL